MDVVTARSVLLYVAQSRSHFGSSSACCDPEGISIFEPSIASRIRSHPAYALRDDVTPVQGLAQKLLATYARSESSALASMIGFDERDLLRYAEQAGFPEVQMDAHFEVIAYPESLSSTPGGSDAILVKTPWDTFVRSAPNPLSPTLEEAMAAAFTPGEAARFRPTCAYWSINARGASRGYVYLWAVKHLS